MSYLFLFHVPPDVDHMAPLAWKLLEEGDEVHGVISAGLDPAGDHRLEKLRSYPSFHQQELWPSSGGGGRTGRAYRRLRGYLRGTLPYAFLFLRRHRVELLATEWGYGLPPGFERPRSRAWAVALLRSLVRSFVRPGSDPRRARANFLVAARVRGVPTVCLPHGLSIKLDLASNAELADLLKDGPIDWRDRNRVSAYVFNTEHHRQWHLEHAMGDPEVMQTWGSLRWAPEWFELNRRLVPNFRWPGDPEGRVKVVLMVPKWVNQASPEATAELIKRMQELDFVSLAIMGHPRPKRGTTDPLRADPDIRWADLHDLTGANSVAVIDACDAMIDVGSSIGIEAVMQGKVLINPTYVHELTTLFDEVEGSCVLARDAHEVVEYLRAHAAGRPSRVDADAYGELMRRAVYGSHPEPFDVIDVYRRRVQELAAAQRHRTERGPSRTTTIRERTSHGSS